LRFAIPYQHRALGYVHDLAIAGGAYLVAMALRLGVEEALAWPGLWRNTALFVAVAAVVLPLFSLNTGSWRYASLRDVFAIVQSTTAATLVFALLVFLIERGASLPRTVPVIAWFVMIVGLSAPRLFYRTLKDGYLAPALFFRPPAASGTAPVLVYGYNDAADLFIRSVRRGRAPAVTIAGIIDDRPKNRRRRLHDVRVLGALAELPAIMRDLAKAAVVPGKLIVADHATPKADLTRIIDAAAEVGLVVERLPDLSSRSAPAVITPSAIAVEDLLGRQPVRLDLEGMRALVAQKTVLVTGAGGSIGSELCRQIAALSARRLVLVENSEAALYAIEEALAGIPGGPALDACLADIRDANRIRALVRATRPALIFHAAALKHVPIVEAHVAEGVKTNVLGTRNVADAALEAGAEAFVMISTDKAVNPTSVLGLTKRVAEAYCQSLDVGGGATRFITVRFGNVLGSNGSVVPRFRRQIAAGGPITVTHKAIERYFMTIPEAAQLVLHAIAYSLSTAAGRGRILVLDMGSPVRIIDLARRMIQLAGLPPDAIPIVETGLRPGEKMYEELFESSEHVQGSGADGVLIAAPRLLDAPLIAATLAEAERLAERGDADGLVACLTRLVPEYVGDRLRPPPRPYLVHEA